MARRRKGEDIHGWVILDKPLDISSTQAVSAVRRLFNAKKAGHAGTLDPLATGILPIALGEATKTVPFAVEGSKTYRFTIKWGERTDTLDREGEIVATSDVRPDRAAIEAVLPDFIGDIQQVPPAYSAIKVDGERAYDLARSGEDVQLQARTVRIDDLRLLDCTDRDLAVLEMHCGKGAYVRSLARDIAFALGTEGHVAALRRNRVGQFTEAESTRLDVLEEMAHKGAASEALLPVQTALDDIPALAITDEESFQLKLGRPIVLLPRQAQELKAQRRPREIAGKDCTFTALALCDGVAVALGDARAGKFQPSRVFNLTS
ncbi:tRNA pseudouridine(55) synthase TruB [Maricaulis sp.]|uniref:tRNA pseudouridine(55) synthase TruB n=1 Tax=Maricaulis sp. TaxID=1486257 RepID=UPI0025C4F310|nr:tRNA pseudouridine(55) synthase TruB [Maricaulis sp.]